MQKTSIYDENCYSTQKICDVTKDKQINESPSIFSRKNFNFVQTEKIRKKET